MTASELADELEVSERTIYRDLEALHASGVPVLAERGPGGGCTLPDNYRSNLTGLSEHEVRALFLSAVPGPLADLGLGKSIEAAVLKLTASLPAVQRDNIGQMRERIHIDTAEWFRPPEHLPHLDTMQRAVWDDHCVEVLYTRSDRRPGAQEAGAVRAGGESRGLVHGGRDVHPCASIGRYPGEDCAPPVAGVQGIAHSGGPGAGRAVREARVA